MSKRKNTETLTEPKGIRVDPVDGGQAARVIVPRGWLIAFGALLTVPWLIVTAIYVWGPMRAGGDATKGADAAAATLGKQQPWGQLETTPIMISPPLEYVSANWGPKEPLQWQFPGTSNQQLEQFLTSVGLDRQQVQSLLSVTRPEARINGLVVSPEAKFVRALTPEVRSRLYLQLAKSPLNFFQHNAYRHFAPSTEAWLGRRLITPETFRLVEPLVYRVGDFLYFADIPLVRSDIGEGPELQRLAKGLLREATMLVKLHVPDASRVAEIAEYWGRAGRRTDIRPLIESIAASGPGASIDISHLLPALAREHLYRYPRISLKDLEKPSFRNCFWTALNFFNAEPDDRFLDANYAVEKLKRDYYIVQDGYQLGDVVAYSDSSGQYFHAAVYLADNLVFGKNGTSPLSPWTIVPIERLKGYYVEISDPQDWNVLYYRRKDL